MVWDSGIECPNIEETECALMKLHTPEIHFSETAFNKTRFLLKKYPSLEWLAAMIGNKYEDHKYRIEDLVIIEQQVTSCHCDISPNGRKEIGKIQNVIGWIHSHNTMDAFQSGTDVETSHNYPVSITVNNELKFAAVVKEKIDCPHINISDVFRKATVYIPIEKIDFPELEKICDEKITEKTYNFTTTYSDYGEEGYCNPYLNAARQSYLKDHEETTEITKPNTDKDGKIVCIICDKQVGKHNLVICQTCGDPMHKKCAKEHVLCPECEADIEEEINTNTKNYTMFGD